MFGLSAFKLAAIAFFGRIDWAKVRKSLIFVFLGAAIALSLYLAYERKLTERYNAGYQMASKEWTVKWKARDIEDSIKTQTVNKEAVEAFSKYLISSSVLNDQLTNIWKNVQSEKVKKALDKTSYKEDGSVETKCSETSHYLGTEFSKQWNELNAVHYNLE